MAANTTSKRGFGGFGALCFLGTLGTAAYYVQQRAVPEEHNLIRAAATLLPGQHGEELPLVLPWQDRLDLDGAAMVPITGLEEDEAPGDEVEPDGEAEVPPQGDVVATANPESARFVQDLGDGHRILYTLDPVLQQSALQIFENREVPYGAAVVLDLRDNAVLALAGHSTMDPNVDPMEITNGAWAPAASTFKLVTTAALLSTGAATAGTKACFSGGLHGITDAELRDEPSRDKTCATLSSAVAHSHNLVIAKLALRHLSQEQLYKITRAFQFEQDIPFEFKVERSRAHIPGNAVERAKIAAGFWHVDMSPLHGAIMASIFARGGVYQPPHAIAQVIGPDDADLTPAAPAPVRVLERDVANAVGQMMLGTTTEGTAKISFMDRRGNPFITGMQVAGKTGSLTASKPPALNYNWFIGYAPAKDPKIAFAVLLANEPKWQIKAHYAARRLVQIWLERRDAIAKHRDARLSRGAVTMPVREAQVVATTAEAPQKKTGARAVEKDTPTPVASSPAQALPPVPGGLPDARK